jgi:transcriptional regulator GlxA family with amidase domain
MKIAIVAFDQFTDLDVFLPWDLLNRVRLVGGVNNWDVKIVGTEPTHVSISGLTIPMMGSIDELAEADAVLFASGPSTRALVKDVAYLERFRLDHERQYIGSMCSGALILGALGFLNGKRATTYPTAREQLAGYGVEVANASFVDLGQVATAAGCLAGEELTAWVIRNLIGQEMVEKVLESVQPVGRGLS